MGKTSILVLLGVLLLPRTRRLAVWILFALFGSPLFRRLILNRIARWLGR